MFAMTRYDEQIFKASKYLYIYENIQTQKNINANIIRV